MGQNAKSQKKEIRDRKKTKEEGRLRGEGSKDVYDFKKGYVHQATIEPKNSKN